MSLLDDVSIVVTPNGYKAGELYAVVPVPTEGADVIINGDFATDSDWSKGTGWTISGGSANCDGTQTGATNLNPTSIPTIVNGQTYLLSLDVTLSAGTLSVFAFSSGALLSESSIGTNTLTLYFTKGAGGNLYIQGNADFIGSIDNVSVKEYTSADMDVTRETAATRVDENGLVNYAEVLGGEEVTNGSFIGVANGTDVITLSGWSAYNTPASRNIENEKLKIVATGSNQGVRLSVPTTSGKSYQLRYNATGDLGFQGIYINGVAAINTSTDTNYVFTSIASNTVIYFRAATNSAGTTLYDNVSVKEVTRDNVPRIDYTGGGCPHILAEPERTNNLTASQDLTDSFWNSINIETVVASTVLSPDGTTFGFKAIPTASSGNTTHYVDYDFGFLSIPIGELTYSVFAKPFGYTNFQLATSSGMNSRYQNFELTGDGVLGAGNVNGAKIEKIGDWYRCSITETSTSTSPRVLNLGLPSSGLGRNPSFVGNSTDGVLLWGGQIEEGTYGTSYIPNLNTTSGSTVTRNQDIFTRDGIGSLINSTEGVFFLEFAALEPTASINNWITISDGTTNAANYIAFVFETVATGGIVARATVGGVATAYISTSALDQSINRKLAFKWKENDFAFWIDGVEVGTNVSGSTFPTSTLNKITFSYNDLSNNLIGKVKQLQVYDTALTDEQLLQLTGESGTDFYESYAEMASALTYTIQ